MKKIFILSTLVFTAVLSGCKKELAEHNNSVASESHVQSTTTETGTAQTAPAAEVLGRYN